MIKSLALTDVQRQLESWIRSKISEAGAKTAVVGLSGGADSALVAILCSRVVPTVCVRMPCHSSPESLARAEELAAKFKLLVITVNLDPAFTSIRAQATDMGEYISTNPDDSKIIFDCNRASNAALRSCLRAPTLDFVAKMTQGLIVGTGNRDEDEVTRYFQKRGDGAVDILPIAKLHKSEVYQLLEYLGCPRSIMAATPTADLWGPDSGQADEKELGMTYKEVEWGISMEDKHHALTAPVVPAVLLYDSTPRQIEVLKTLRSMEKATRHKARLPEVYDVRAAMTMCFEAVR